MELQSGTMVVLWQKHENIEISARRFPEPWAQEFPEPIRSPRAPLSLQREAWDRVVCGTIPAGSLCLYMSSKNDAFTEALSGRKGPRGWRPAKIVFHLIMWGDRPVWVSSEDCELKSPEWKP